MLYGQYTVSQRTKSLAFIEIMILLYNILIFLCEIWLVFMHTSYYLVPFMTYTTFLCIYRKNITVSWRHLKFVRPLGLRPENANTFWTCQISGHPVKPTPFSQRPTLFPLYVEKKEKLSLALLLFLYERRVNRGY